MVIWQLQKTHPPCAIEKCHYFVYLYIGFYKRIGTPKGHNKFYIGFCMVSVFFGALVCQNSLMPPQNSPKTHQQPTPFLIALRARHGALTSMDGSLQQQARTDLGRSWFPFFFFGWVQDKCISDRNDVYRKGKPTMIMDKNTFIAGP